MFLFNTLVIQAFGREDTVLVAGLVVVSLFDVHVVTNIVVRNSEGNCKTVLWSI